MRSQIKYTFYVLGSLAALALAVGAGWKAQ
ncbi:MAG: hypothetical protein QOI60_204 [Actinomycetota bacterium]|jgi:hypothetical protein|nr:hypothetical protein [Actinomycetota bacterium]MEA2556655.1 hypothetical protein [Actinomycetota bacterium]MEA2581513.1 hypothetical protein [Actinomycetota bacterium]